MCGSKILMAQVLSERGESTGSCLCLRRGTPYRFGTPCRRTWKRVRWLRAAQASADRRGLRGREGGDRAARPQPAQPPTVLQLLVALVSVRPDRLDRAALE